MGKPKKHVFPSYLKTCDPKLDCLWGPSISGSYFCLSFPPPSGPPSLLLPHTLPGRWEERTIHSAPFEYTSILSVLCYETILLYDIFENTPKCPETSSYIFNGIIIFY
jgi:hypothetical protein